MSPSNDNEPPSDQVFRGWFDIAVFLEVSERTARRLAAWGREHRCPVFEDYRGPYARRGELVRWQRDSVLPVGVRERMRPVGRKSA